MQVYDSSGLAVMKFWAEASGLSVLATAEPQKTKLKIERVQYDARYKCIKSLPG